MNLPKALDMELRGDIEDCLIDIGKKNLPSHTKKPDINLLNKLAAGQIAASNQYKQVFEWYPVILYNVVHACQGTSYLER